MKTSMRIIGTLGLATLFALVGCKKEATSDKKGEEKGGDKGGGSDLVKAYNDLADEVCKCADMKCVNDVQTKATDLAGKMSGSTPSEDDQKAISDATQKWAKCAEEIAKKEAGAGTEGGAGGADAVKAYQEWADAVCACKDAACVSDAQGKATELGSKMQGFTPTAEEAQAIASAGEKAAKCVQDITAAGTGGGTTGTEGGGGAAGSADDFVKQYNELADAVCACKDTNCLMESMQKAQDLGTKAGEIAASMTAEQGQAVAAAGQKMSDCASKITGAGTQ